MEHDPKSDQPYGKNVKEILLKISWHTHIKNPKPYPFIIQTMKKPLDGLCNHILFASTLILIFKGIFIHNISRILIIKLKLLRVPIVYF